MQVHGSCHCRSIEYEAQVDPRHTHICHCTDCQALTGSAYRVTVQAREGSFRLTRGEPTVYVKVGDIGRRRAQAFCGRCGSPLYTYSADHPKVYGLRVGCLAERAALVPTAQVWCRSALAWTSNLAGLPRADAE